MDRVSNRAVTAAGQQDALERLAKDPSASIRAGVARVPRLSPSTLDRLAADPATAVRAAVGANPSTPQPALGRLAGMPGPQIAVAVAGNPSAPAAALLRLAGSANIAVRRAVAANPATPNDIRSTLQAAVGPAQHVQQPPIDVAGLVGEASRTAGGAVAERALTELVQLWGVGLWAPLPVELAALAAGSQAGARLAGVLVLNAEAPGIGAAELLLSLWQPVSEEYAKTISQFAAAGVCSWPLAETAACSQARRVVLGASRPGHQLPEAARHEDRWVRVGAALHPRPGDVLDALLDDRDETVVRFATEVFGKALSRGALL